MPVAVDELQRALAALAARLGTDVERLLRRTGALDQQELLAFLTDAYPELVVPYEAAAAELTAQYYGEQSTTTKGFVAESAGGAPAEQLAASARWAALQNAPISALQGSASRAVMNSSRDTVLHNVAREPGARWARHASANACGFCRMLATRGASYSSASAAGSVVGRRGRERGARKLGQKYHDNCHCIAVPIRPGDDYSPPDYVKQWEQDYRAATKGGASGPKDIAQAMDRMGAERVKESRHRANVAAWLDAEDEHRRRVEYWRRVDDEDLHSIPPAERAEPELPQVVESPLDRAQRELEDAIESGDDARIGAAADALERIEDTERKAAAKVAQAAERKAQKANEQSDRIVGLIEQGWDPAEAESEVTGKSVESIRRRDFIAQSRAEGHSGAGFDDLITSVHDRMVVDAAIAAEDATNGYMVKRAYELKVNPKQLWSVNDATARKWMSDEMAAWFDANGRLTRPILRQMVLSGQYNIGKFTSQGQDFLQ